MTFATVNHLPRLIQLSEALSTKRRYFPLARQWVVMRALLLLLALVASTSAFCPPPYSWREYVFAKGHSNVTLYDKNAVLKGLRVALVSYGESIGYGRAEFFQLPRRNPRPKLPKFVRRPRFHVIFATKAGGLFTCFDFRTFWIRFSVCPIFPTPPASSAPLNQTTERTTLLATATTDDTGFYVIAGSAHYTCYHYDSYRLQLYYDEVANYPLSKVEIPSSYVIRDDQPVKVFESDISADYFPPPS